MSELGKKSNPQEQAIYAFAFAFFVGAIIFAAAVWFSFDKINEALEQKNVELAKKIVELEKELELVKSTGTKTPDIKLDEDTKTPDIKLDEDTKTPDVKKEDSKYLGSEGAKVVLTSDDVDLSKSPYLGAADAEIVMVEFSDFQCPYCTRAYPTVKKIIENYGDKVKLVFAHLPLSFHPEAQKAAEAAECASDQDKFWEYHDILFETGELSIDNLKAHAKTLNLDTEEFDNCLDGGLKKVIVGGHAKLAQQNGASGTPTFFLNGKKIVGAQPYENFAAEIEAILSGKPIPTQEPTPTPTPTPSPIKTVDISDREIKGSSDAEIIMVEFSEYQCPYCKRVQPTVEQLIEEYDGKVAMAHMNFIVHASAHLSSQAVECAGDQDKYFQMHDKIFETSKTDEAGLKEVAAEIGLDMDKFNPCLEDGEKIETIDAQTKIGKTQAIRGTPSFIIGKLENGKVSGNLLVGAQPITEFKKTIDSLLGIEVKLEPAVEPTQEPKPTAILADISDRAIKGPKDAVFTIIEFSEYQCPYCKRVQPTVEQLIEEYDGNVNMAHMNFIVHASAHLSSQAVECAGDQDKYFQMHDKIFETSKTDEAGLKEVAAEIGLDIEQFNNCLDSAEKAKIVDEQTAIGKSVGVSGTPSFIIGPNSGGQVFGGFMVGAQPIENFRKILDSQIDSLKLQQQDGPSPGPDPMAYD